MQNTLVLRAVSGLLAAAVSTMALGSAAVSANQLCLDGTVYTTTFDESFTTFSRYDPQSKSGTWDTAYPWGRSNPGTMTAAFDIDRTYRVGSGKALEIDPFVVGSGELRITPLRAPEWLRPQIGGYAYVTGVITTRHSFSQQYGYFEARLQTPHAPGLLSAFWLMPVDGWPPEIDVMEILGSTPDRVYQTVHRADHRWEQHIAQGLDASRGFHTYAILWTADTVTYFVDGIKTAELPNVSNQPMYMLADLDVGGPRSWEGEPDATSLPSSLRIQFVRAYQSRGVRCTVSRG
jgi:beta-glucanase (GH16 family)